MWKRRTSQVRRRQQVKVLRANVMTPRIFWFDVLRMAGGMLRFALVVALVALAAWGVWRGVQTGLVENDEFRLRSLILNENPVLDELRLLEVTGIDPVGSLFKCDPDAIESSLTGLPEVASARVIREFPGTLTVEVVAREPACWISCADQGLRPRDPATGLLVDWDGHAFRCPPGMFEEARTLPVIELRGADLLLGPGQLVEHPDFRRGRRLFDAAKDATPLAPQWIDTIRQHKGWGSKLITSDGTEALFKHGDLERQMGVLLASIDRAQEKGKQIATIALIGKRRIPITYRENVPPRAIIVDPAVAPPGGVPAESEPAPPESAADPDLLELLEQ